MPPLLCFLLILEYPDQHQNLISSSLYYPGPRHKISSQSVHNFLSNVVHRQTDRQTNVTKNITSFANEVKMLQYVQNYIAHKIVLSMILMVTMTQNSAINDTVGKLVLYK